MSQFLYPFIRDKGLGCLRISAIGNNAAMIMGAQIPPRGTGFISIGYISRRESAKIMQWSYNSHSDVMHQAQHRSCCMCQFG